MYIQRTIRREFEHATTVTIAHRLATIQDSSLILVMDQGRIVESGTHDELLARGGVYHELVQSQSNVTNAAGRAL